MRKVSLLFCFCILFAFEFATSNAADGKVGFYELKKGKISMKLTNYGAALVSLVIPDKTGKPTDVVLGYDTIEEYQKGTAYFGAIVGRVANRIGGAQFKLKGQQYKLVANEGKNMLHGGPNGFSKVIWKVLKYQNEGVSPFIIFSYDSPDGDQGFPGSLRVLVRYSLDGNKLDVSMKARSLDKKESPINLAQHSYWNLGGHNSGNILEEKLQILGQRYTPVNNELIPTGEILNVSGTAYDFTQPNPVGKRINELPKGYDINYVLDGYVEDKSRIGYNRTIRAVATVEDSKSGLKMEVKTTAPGLQFNSGDLLKDIKGKGGFVYQAHAGLCLETQWFPDFVNHPDFPQSTVKPKEMYSQLMIYTFSTI